MDNFKRYLNDIEFHAAVDDLDQLNDTDCYHVHQVYISPVVQDEIEVNYTYHYDSDANKVIDSIIFEITVKDETIFTCTKLYGLQDYYDNFRNISKKIALYRQWQHKGLAKETIKFALKDLKNSIIDLWLARFRTIKIKLGGKFQ